MHQASQFSLRQRELAGHVANWQGLQGGEGGLGAGGGLGGLGGGEGGLGGGNAHFLSTTIYPSLQ